MGKLSRRFCWKTETAAALKEGIEKEEEAVTVVVLFADRGATFSVKEEEEEGGEVFAMAVMVEEQEGLLELALMLLPR